MGAEYRARAHEVRKAARARLQELRRSRLGPGPETAVNRTAPVTRREDGQAGDGSEARAAPALVIEVSEAALDLTRAAADVAADRPVGPAATAASGSAEPAEPAGRAEKDRALPDVNDAHALHDLARLPEVGSGLIWLLARAGIRDLADLAAADPDALRGRLGLAGQLLDIEDLVLTGARLAGEPVGGNASMPAPNPPPDGPGEEA